MSEFSKIPKKNPFKIPKGYFEDFSLNLETKIKEERIADRCGRQLPFTVPESYFDSTLQSIQQAIKEKEKPHLKYIRLFAPYAAAAALLIIMFSVWNSVLKDFNINKPQIQYTENSEDKSQLKDKEENADNTYEADFMEEEIARATASLSITEIVELSEYYNDGVDDEPENIEISEYELVLEEYLMENTDIADYLADF